MAEYKQYITQIQENGNVMISEDVIATIISETVSEIEGIGGLAVKPVAEFADLIGMNWGKGMKIIIGENNELTISCNVQIVYGNSVIEVAKNAQALCKGLQEEGFRIVSGDTDKMVAFERDTVYGQYVCNTKLLPLENVANFEKKVPREWINAAGNGIERPFIDYVLPLIQGETPMVKENGLPRFAKLKKIFAE